MPFFQNSSTQTAAPLSAPLLFTAGRDIIDNPAIHNWSSFLTDAKHTDRRQAFQEFIFMMLYYRNRVLEESKFPHNVLYEKVLQYYVETVSLSIGTSTIQAPKNSSGSEIFEVDSGTEETLKPIYPYTAYPSHVYPFPNAHNLPKLLLNVTTVTNQVTTALATGATSLGFFQEVSTLFSYFYIIRQMTILNGNKFNFCEPIQPATSTAPYAQAQPVLFYVDEDNYKDIRTGGVTTLSERTRNMMSEINKPEGDLPYFYNSLLTILKNNNFNIPLPLITDADSAFMSYIIKNLDPNRPLGVLNSSVKTEIVLPSICSQDLPTLLCRNAIIFDPPKLSRSFRTYCGNHSFIKDLMVTMRSGNGIKDASGFPMTGIAGAPKPFYNPTTAFTLSTYEDLARQEIKKIFDKIQDVIKETIQTECLCMMKILYANYTDVPKNTILASGAGQTSISILGIRDFGLPFFNYSLKDDAEAETSKSATTSIDISKSQSLHIGVYALDLINSTGTVFKSEFAINVDGIEIYKFKFIPESTPQGDIKIEVVSLPYDPGPPEGAFFNVEDTVSNTWKFYKKMNVHGSSPSLSNFELVAEYHVNSRDLRFRKFSAQDIAVYNISPPLKNLSYTVNSQFYQDGSKKVYEELFTLISIYEDQTPSIFSDDALFASDTFQLYGLPDEEYPHKFVSINKPSYNRLLTDQSQINAVKFILESLKNEISSPGFITLSPPILLGGFVGKKISSASTVVLGSSLQVMTDDSYQPKFPLGTHTGDETYPESVKVLRYSSAEVKIIPNIPPPGIPTSIDIELTIKSYVSPPKSVLESQYITPGLPDDPDEVLFVSLKSGGAASNQILAMLRSFGLLEALYHRIIEILNTMGYDSTEVAFVTNKLKAWFPDQSNSAATDTIVCKDEPFTGALLLAPDINLTQYYILKRSY